MHITDIKAFPVWIGTRNQMLVKVETNEGIYGWGESGLSTRELGVKGIIDHYKDYKIMNNKIVNLDEYKQMMGLE